MPKPRGVKIEYFNEEEELQQEEPASPVEAEIIIEDEPQPEETDSEASKERNADRVAEEPKSTKYVSDDLEDYVYQERVGVLELINYLPRVPKPVLAGDRDFTPEEWAITQEDYSRGFRPLEEKYVIKYQVPSEASKFRLQEDLSREITKVSTGMVAKWIKFTNSDNPRKFPEGLLKDTFGFTQYAVAIYRNLMENTCTREFIPNEDGIIEWDKINRDDPIPPIKNPEFSRENPKYPLAPLYWEKVAQMWFDYCDRMAWINEYKQARALREQEPEVVDLGDSDRELFRQASQFAAKVELMKAAALNFLDSELEDLNRKAVRTAKQKGIKGRADAMEAYAEAFNQGEPQPLEEEEDIWNEQQI